MSLLARDIILAPVITEKSHDSVERGTYTFRVHPRATKADIHNAVEEIFKVKVLKVNTVNVKMCIRDRAQGRSRPEMLPGSGREESCLAKWVTRELQ